MTERIFVSLAILVLLSGATSSLADELSVPRFPILSSPMVLQGDVRPHQFLSTLGRQAAWLGRETGEAEVWVHPFKLAADFHLDFGIPDYLDPVRGVDVARTVTIRPELVTITYSHATFTVHQHILAPLNEAGILILLDVESFRALEIVVNFKTVFQYAWPGAFGGQYTFWNEDENAFVLSESLRERNAVIGSPWAGSASLHPAHALSDTPNRFVIPVDSHRAQREYIPIGIVAATAPTEEVFGIYRRLIDNAAVSYREKRAHVQKLLDETTVIDTPEDELDLAFDWSKINLDEALCCNPDLGCGLVAGWGPSGASARAGFGWFFGGDAAINTIAMDGAGLWPQVAEGLRFLARYQREDGKIAHEISQAAGRMPWFSDFPYPYYHADTTPYWVVAVSRYWRASGDDAYLQEIWPNLKKAYQWCVSTETDGDGIIENTSGGLGAIEVGEIGEGIHQDIYLAGVWVEALEAMRQMAGYFGDNALSTEVRGLHTKARKTLNEKYWREEEGYHAFGILQSGRTNDNLTVWPATAAAFGLLDSPRAEATLTHLSRDRISTDWGAHMLSTESLFYDPMGYNSGAVWPFVTGFVSWGQYRYQRPWAGYHLLDALRQMTFDWARGRHPELLSGSYYRPLDAAVPQQFFATSMLVTSVLQGMLGWEPDAPHSRATLTPQIPPQWEKARIRNLRVGKTAIDLTIWQRWEETVVELEGHGPKVTIDVVLPVPLGARSVDGTPKARVETNGRRAKIPLDVEGKKIKARLRWNNGLVIEPPSVDLEPGQPSLGIRVLDFRYADGIWWVDLEGIAGETYEIRFRGEPLSKVEGGRLVRRRGYVSTVAVEFPAGSGRKETKVRLIR